MLLPIRKRIRENIQIRSTIFGTDFVFLLNHVVS